MADGSGAPPATVAWSSWRAPAGAAAVVYGTASVVSAVAQAAVVGFSVVTPEQLLHDVATSRALWVAAVALQVGQQQLIPVVILGFLAVVGRPRGGTVLGVAQLGVAALLFTLSGVFHGVMGVHLARFDSTDGDPRTQAIQATELVHALGDTTYFVGVAVTAIAMVALVGTIRRTPGLPDGLVVVGLTAAAFEVAEFGWFLAPGLAVGAPVGLVAQSAWFVWLGVALLRAGARVPASP